MGFFDSDSDILSSDIIQQDVHDNGFSDMEKANIADYINNIERGCAVFLDLGSKKIIVDYKHQLVKEYREEYIPIGIAYKYDKLSHKASVILPNLLCKKGSVYGRTVNEIIKQFEQYVKRFISLSPPAKAIKRLKLEIADIEAYRKFLTEQSVHEAYKGIFGADKYKDFMNKLKTGGIFIYNNRQLKYLMYFKGKEKFLSPELLSGTFMVITKIKLFLH